MGAVSTAFGDFNRKRKTLRMLAKEVNQTLPAATRSQLASSDPSGELVQGPLSRAHVRFEEVTRSPAFVLSGVPRNPHRAR